MFTNRRKDPLVDSVQKVMKENSLRREAEAALNRSLGITSKRALPHEKHAAYDKALAEATTKVLSEGVEQIDEISKGLAARYIKKASSDMRKKDAEGHASHPEPHDKRYGDLDRRTKLRQHAYSKWKKADKREQGIARAADKLAKEETEINEVSKKLVSRYINKANRDSDMSSFQHGKLYGKELATKKKPSADARAQSKAHADKGLRREKGISTAVKKLAGGAKVMAKEETLAELSREKLTAYISKAKHSDTEKRQKGVQLAVRKKWADPKYGFKKVAPKVPAGGSWPAAKKTVLKKKLTEWGERPLQNAGVDTKALQPGTKVPAPTAATQSTSSMPPIRPSSVVGALSAAAKWAISPPATSVHNPANPRSYVHAGATGGAQGSASSKPSETPQNASVNKGTGPALAPQKTTAGQPAQSNTDDAEKNKEPTFTKLADRSTPAKKSSVTTSASTTARKTTTSAPKKVTAVRKPSAAGSGGNKGPLSGHPEWARKAFSPDSGG
jgi:hypothetical protein